MIIIENVFYGDSIKEKRKQKIICKIKKRKNLINVNIIIIRLKNKSLMEIVSTRELYRMDKREDGLVIIGIAKDRQDAFCLIEGIISSVFETTGTVDKSMLIKELGIA